ncbi:Ulp1 protease family, C-terminal catalytic domain, partial [Sesbania bispinosa]
VLNLLVCNLTEEEHYLDGSTSTAWFLPTMFAIFVLINDENIHWFHLVIDMDKNNLILLDSNQSDFRREMRRIQVRKVALFLKEMLMDRSFYDFSTTAKPDIAGYSLIEPDRIGKQLPASNGSGIWVANWMKDYDWDDEYDQLNVRTLLRITTACRMRLAIDLVLHECNEMRDDVIKRAKKNWNAIQRHRDKIMKYIFG